MGLIVGPCLNEPAGQSASYGKSREESEILEMAEGKRGEKYDRIRQLLVAKLQKPLVRVEIRCVTAYDTNFHQNAEISLCV
jgi:hypothetical protein